jgi:hypothetical protein
VGNPSRGSRLLRMGPKASTATVTWLTMTYTWSKRFSEWHSLLVSPRSERGPETWRRRLEAGWKLALARGRKRARGVLCGGACLRGKARAAGSAAHARSWTNASASRGYRIRARVSQQRWLASKGRNSGLSQRTTTCSRDIRVRSPCGARPVCATCGGVARARFLAGRYSTRLPSWY